MLRLQNKKGFTLVEVLCSLGVFSIVFICMMSFDVTALNMKKDIKTMNNNVIIIEALKNNIIYKMTYEELKQLEVDKRVYINKEYITFDKIKAGGADMFSNQVIAANPYIKCNFTKNDSTIEVFKISLLLYAGGENGILELRCDFYKGDHK